MSHTEDLNIKAARAAANAGKQLYKTLGVSRWADAGEISRAYRSAARAYHPDKAPDATKAEAEEMFKRVGEAYEILSNPAAKKEYDTATLGGTIPDDLFSRVGAFMSACSAVKQRHHVEERHSILNVSLRDIAIGTIATVYSHELKRTIDITIRPGTLDGTRFRVDGGGTCVYTLVTMRHPTLRRGGDRYTQKDLVTSVDVPLYDVICAKARGVVMDAVGREIKWALQTPSQTLRIYGAGLPDPDEKLPGDLIIEFNISFPPKVSETVAALIAREVKQP